MSTLLKLLKLSPFLFATPILAVGCFSGGASQTYDESASAAIASACAALTGEYSNGQTATSCQNTGSDIHIDFTVVNNGDETYLADGDCITQNTYTAQGCSGHGGIRAYGNLDLTYDPNSGLC